MQIYEACSILSYLLQEEQTPFESGNEYDTKESSDPLTHDTSKQTSLFWYVTEF